MWIMAYSGRRSVVYAAYKQFLLIIIITVMVNVVIYFWCLPSEINTPPYGIQKTFMTTECEDGRRLGNLMFNYASLIGLSKMYNVTPLMKKDFRLFQIFNLSAAQSTNIENSLGDYENYEEYGRRACAFDVGVTHLKRRNLKLHGYFQSWKYFKNAYELVRKEFRFHNHIMSSAKKIHSNIYKSQKPIHGKLTIVGIHIRRGDTLDTHFANYGYTTPDSKYYSQAMRYIEDKYEYVVFIVCSDDKDWSKENIKGENVLFSDTSHDAVDLAVLSLCDHIIISVGSFGWWGAWLANGTTIYYSKWPRPVSKLEYMVTKMDYFLKDWIPLP